MKKQYFSQSLSDSLCSLSIEIEALGNTIVSREKKCKEITFALIEIFDPTDLHIQIQARKFKFLYAISEFMWYLSCDRQTKNIGKLAKIWTEISDEKGEVVSNYGNIVREQWDRTVNELVSDRNSRRATLTINTPSNKKENKLDCPCTMSVQFLIRNGKLDVFVNMRSNDLIFGFCNDVFCWCLFQQMMLNELNAKGVGVELGSYIHFAGSLHVYERHFELLKKCSVQEKTPKGKMKLEKHFTWEYAEKNNKIMTTQNASKEELEMSAIQFFAKEINRDKYT